ncbi:MAG: molybdenum cofactor guanylyltransferase [Sphingomonadales bacterium]|jgi:molybdopterin-guanine dinucleotide biosynthesis protein A|nr:molybdenum cofactor guanylyltransferase [Sphingomonadales bacterium]
MRIVILAGGEGRRIGGGKPMRRLAGETLIDRALRRARTWSDEVLVAAREGGDLEDDPEVEGPLGGVAAALALGGDVLTIPCDMPFLPDDLPARLASGKAAALAASGGHLHPVCALWTAEAATGLPAYLATGRRSLKGFAEAVGYEAAEWPVEPYDPFFNINDEADLARAEALLRSL